MGMYIQEHLLKYLSRFIEENEKNKKEFEKNEEKMKKIKEDAVKMAINFN